MHFSPLRNRAFFHLLAFRLLIVLSYQIVAVVVGWHLYELTRDPLALGLVGWRRRCRIFAARCLPVMRWIIIRAACLAWRPACCWP